MNRTILVPGAGYGQALVAKKAREMGLRVIVVSPPGDYPAFEHADEIHAVDIRDQEAVLEIARTAAIDGIVSDQTDIPVQTMGYVAERLGLRGNDHATALLFTRKDLMRARCEALGVPSIPYEVADSTASALAVADCVGYPVMCKPVDNQSSKGVFRAADAAGLSAGVGGSLAASFSGQVIVEQFIEGPEYCVEGLAIDGRFRNLIALKRSYFAHADTFVPSSSTSPTGLSERERTALFDANTAICTGFGLRNGLSHSEFIQSTHDGRFHLVESAARGGGVFISSHLVSYACDFDTQELLVRLAVGEPLRLEDYADRGRAVRYMCFYLRSGTVTRVNGVEAIRAMRGVLGFYASDLRTGAVATGLIDKSSRLGPILLGGESIAEIEALSRRVREALVVETDTERNAVVWD